VIYLPNPDLSALELKRAILRELQSQMPTDETSEVDLMQLIFERLLHCYQHGKKVIVIIDEAQVLSGESLETLRLLTNVETESKKLLQIVLFAQPELKQRLVAHRSLRQFNQRIVFSHELSALNRKEVGKYIAQRLIVAGHRNGCLFSRTAQNLLHRVSNGVPRLINILAHKSMLAAYGKGIYKVNRWAVKQAIKDSSDILTYRGRWSWNKIAVLSLILTGTVMVAILFVLSLSGYRI
jgi:MSHA biogenesis protein MshM